MNFQDFKSLFEQNLNHLSDTARTYPWENQQAYASWLANTYHYVCNSTRILALAAAHMPPQLTLLSNRFIAHAAEETGHEKLLERDLKSLGYEPKDFPVSHEMKLYHASLYYWMSPAGNPIGLIGWILSLEGIAAKLGPWGHETTQKIYGTKATNFLRVHAEEDPDHLNKALQAASMFNESQLDLVADSMNMYSQQYAEILKAMAKSLGTKIAA